FLPPRRQDRELHLALLDVKDRVRGTALREDGGFLSKVLGGSPPGFRQVHPEIERRVIFLCHESAYLSAELAHCQRNPSRLQGWSSTLPKNASRTRTEASWRGPGVSRLSSGGSMLRWAAVPPGARTGPS